ncbi:MAG TPA: GNAT family N-acetyltransferase [Dictyobacter sp.]|jgi:GNAT superfamily N-acetyltransferase|nr:GNAT family N-acetyltransferase [Dictyobacter sp.]
MLVNKKIFQLRSLTETDRESVRQFMAEHWGSATMVVHGISYDMPSLPGFLAYSQDEWLGLLTYHMQDGMCEIVSLDSLREGYGIGTALIEEARTVARQSGYQRIWLITTNDNLHALRFYQRRGFTLVALYREAVTAARKVKPEIPLIGDNGIPLRDEIELELLL